MRDVVADDIVVQANVDVSPVIIAEVIRVILACFAPKATAREELQSMPPSLALRRTRVALKKSLREQGEDRLSYDELTRIAKAMIDSMLNSDEEVVAACYE